MIFDNGKKLKKRCIDQDNEEITGKSDQKKILDELVLRSEYVLESVKMLLYVRYRRIYR